MCCIDAPVVGCILDAHGACSGDQRRAHGGERCNELAKHTVDDAKAHVGGGGVCDATLHQCVIHESARLSEEVAAKRLGHRSEAL